MNYNKMLAAKMAIQRGGKLPIDYAFEMAQHGVLLEEFEEQIDGFSVDKFIEEYEYHEHV